MGSPSTAGSTAWLRRRVHTPSWWQIDGLVVLLVIVEMVADAQSRILVHGQRQNDGWMYVLIVVMSVPYLTHRRWPMGSLAVTLGAVAVFSLAAYAPFPGIPAFILLF